MTSVTWEAVLARRLERHFLAMPSATAGPADVAGAICGAHAQVLSAAELSIGLRLAKADRAAVQGALWGERSLVKTFGPRGTVHLLPTRDLPIWTGALAAIPTAASGLAPDARLTPDQTDQVVAAIAAALRDTELTADELTEAVVATTGPWAGDLVMPAFQGYWPRWRQAIGIAAHRGALCFGANRGRKVTYTNPHRWLPGFAPALAEEALGEVVRRYLHAYGPATSAEFAQWLSAPRPWAAALFDSLGGALEQVEGSSAWQLAGDVASAGAVPTGVRLLPYFDAYTVGSHPRALIFPGRASERALSGGQAGNFPVLLIDGVVGGVWHLRRAGRKVELTVEPFQQLSAARRRGLDEQVERIGAFLDSTPTLTIGTVTVGGHA